MKRKKKSNIKADTFAVWGSPPQALLRALTPLQIRILKKYIDTIVDSCYPSAFDSGADKAFNMMSETIQEYLKQLNKLKPIVDKPEFVVKSVSDKETITRRKDSAKWQEKVR